MGNCGACRFWVKRDQQGVMGHQLGLGVCPKVPNYWDATNTSPNDEFENGEDNRVLKPEFQGTSAFVLDGSGYRAELLTAPERHLEGRSDS